MAAGGAPLTVGPVVPRSKEPAVKKNLEKSQPGAVSAHWLASST